MYDAVLIGKYVQPTGFVDVSKARDPQTSVLG